MPVTFATRLRYCDLAEQLRVHEFDVQVGAIKRGFSSIVPSRALTLFTWSELEVLVSGSPKIDVDLLKERTVYEGYGRDHKVIKLFWKVFCTFSDDEQSKFIRFVWGRSRLPSAKSWSRTKPFKIQRKAVATDQLPQAHTVRSCCWWILEPT